MTRRVGGWPGRIPTNMRWDQLWIAVVLCAKEWFILHSVKRQWWPQKIRDRFDRGEYPAQPGSKSGPPP